MADRTSGDLPGNGEAEGQPGSSQFGRDEQSLTDREQTLADADQTESDSDQSASDSDQAAADSDQAASDRALEQGGDPHVHQETRDLRHRSTRTRVHTASARYEAAAERDRLAHDRDVIAGQLDKAADIRDRDLAARDAEWAGDAHKTAAAEMLLRAAQDRRRAAADRAQAAADRDRAARERARARSDREALMQQLITAETDALTGARTRGAGLADLEREVERARRTNALLAVAYVDLVGLKKVNDTRGHGAGDALLQRVVDAIGDQLRSYDLIVRVGGDEFVCALSGATLDQARARFVAVRAALARQPEPCDIKVGFAEFAPGIGLEEIIERADADLPAALDR